MDIDEALRFVRDHPRGVLAGGERPDWDEYRAAMERERRCVIVLSPEDVGPTLSG